MYSRVKVHASSVSEENEEQLDEGLELPEDPEMDNDIPDDASSFEEPAFETDDEEDI